MAEKIDMSLDDIIKREGIRGARRGRGGARGGKGGRGGGGGGGGFGGIQQKSRTLFKRSFSGRFNSGGGGGQRGGQRYNNRGGGGGKGQSTTGQWLQRKSNQLTCRLHLSNLAYSVTDEDLFELFASFGPLKKSTVHYDQYGRSLGTAELLFELKFDAMKAMNQYNGVPLDGRPMRIREIGAKREESQSEGSGGGGGGRSGGSFNRGGGRGGRGGGRGGGRQPRTNVTQEDLDKDLDSWRMETE
ncbi:unnamed protein product [Medioppia subpectinata]|uniref:RRM domain-containing protein n=1 Tax=Medioppia subpectinata TaxID=1979941 RepID=A0A7R9KR84_9ACAR|nr:unnamed protein product [Medioppia subpectinata]CAG2108220.1 unnamed protein product [Medioppia subpectinata]